MSRPKGFSIWTPKPETRALLSQVNEVLDEYREQLPLTNRQIFYRLVGAYGFDKTEKAYSRLCEHLVRARRAGMIDFRSIRDDGTKKSGGGGYWSEESFWQVVDGSADRYRRDRQAGQPQSIEIWCEAAGMLPQLAKVARPYSIPVYATGGFSSVTVTHDIARRAAEDYRETLFLHVGDFDPSGESIFEAMAADAGKFLVDARVHEECAQLLGVEYVEAGAGFEPRRIALTAEQVEQYDLPTAPPKRSDTRSVNWIGDTCQAEALPPDLLASIVTSAIESALDRDVYDELLKTEEIERESIKTRLAEFMEGER